VPTEQTKSSQAPAPSESDGNVSVVEGEDGLIVTFNSASTSEVSSKILRNVTTAILADFNVNRAILAYKSERLIIAPAPAKDAKNANYSG
jgi:hypothetical protein